MLKFHILRTSEDTIAVCGADTEVHNNGLYADPMIREKDAINYRIKTYQFYKPECRCKHCEKWLQRRQNALRKMDK